MKQILLFLFFCVAISSCNTTNNLKSAAERFAKAHNFQEAHSINPITGANHIEASIDSLYKTEKLKAVCDTADITWKIIQARVEIKTDCPGLGATLVEQLGKIWSAIDFVLK